MFPSYQIVLEKQRRTYCCALDSNLPDGVQNSIHGFAIVGYFLSYDLSQSLGCGELEKHENRQCSGFQYPEHDYFSSVLFFPR
jgi:hypothetical protein